MPDRVLWYSCGVIGRSNLLAALLVAALTCTAWTARADGGRPTSGDMSIISGRTLGNSQTVLAAGIGWPGLWAGVWLAPSSRINLGLRGSVLYGSPIMGFTQGVGGELSVPIRWHIFGKGQLDVSLAFTPAFTIGQGSLAGQEDLYSDNLGYAARGEAGILAGAQLSRSVTLTLGAMGTFGFVNVPDTTGGAYFLGTAFGVAGIELLVSRDTMFIVETNGGYGFASSKIYASHAIGRVWVGIAYLL